MTDTKPQPKAKPSVLDRLREFMDSLGGEEAEIQIPAEETDEGDIEPGSEEEAHAAENLDGGDATPGTEEDDTPEDGDLRATIRDQAALIETYRNTLAAAGIEDPAEVEEEVKADLDTPDEDETIAAFETDYAAREAKLAALRES